MTLRWARSPVAPKSVRIDGSGTRSRRSPSRRTFSVGRAREGRFAARPSRDSRRSRIVRGASLARGEGRAGMGVSDGASVGVPVGVSVGAGVRVRAGARVGVFVPATTLLRLDRVAAELVPQGGEDLGPVGVGLARAEPRQQRERDDRGGDVVVDGVLDGPTALAGVLDIALDVFEILAVGLERATGELEEPRANDGALHPQ